MSTEIHPLNIQHPIFKVHDRLRRHNEEAYEPQCLSIGPYHRDKVNLQVMEMHKKRFLQKLTDDEGEQGLSLERDMRNFLKECEKQARRFYGDKIDLTTEDFVEIMLLDGCFIIEFLRRAHNPSLRVQEDDNIFNVPWLLKALRKDLILFENQVPFFILVKLFDMTKFRDQEQQNLIQMAMIDLANLVSNYSCSAPTAPNQVSHLPYLVHEMCSFLFAAIRSADDHDNYDNDAASIYYIKSTSELEARGVKFQKATENAAWLDITWENGVIKIPRLIVNDITECVLRNLIAYEQYNPVNNQRKYITDYVVVMDILIKSPADVEILRDCQIVENWLGDDEAVSTMFNNLTKEVVFNRALFCYSDVLKEVDKFSSRRWNIWRHWNIWRAKLMRNYSKTPWFIISFIGAVMLLILTFLQTGYTIRSSYKN